MTDMLDVGNAFLEAQRTAHMARSVVYVRDSAEPELSVTVAATLGTTIFRVDDAHGVLERYEARDFLILVADLILDGSKITPAAGDKVRFVVDGQTITYEVMAPGGEPCWKYCPPYERTFRIHTKRIKTEVVS